MPREFHSKSNMSTKLHPSLIRALWRAQQNKVSLPAGTKASREIVNKIASDLAEMSGDLIFSVPSSPHPLQHLRVRRRADGSLAISIPAAETYIVNPQMNASVSIVGEVINGSYPTADRALAALLDVIVLHASFLPPTSSAINPR